MKFFIRLFRPLYSFLFFSRIKGCLRLLIVSEDSYLYLYALNLDEGGDCTLMKRFSVASGVADGEDSEEEDGEESEESSYQSETISRDIVVRLINHFLFCSQVIRAATRTGSRTKI